MLLGGVEHADDCAAVDARPCDCFVAGFVRMRPEVEAAMERAFEQYAGVYEALRKYDEGHADE